MALNDDQVLTYKTLIDAAQQAPQGLALHPGTLDDKDVAVVMVKMALRGGGTSYDWMPLAILVDETIVERMKVNGQSPKAESPHDYDSRFVTDTDDDPEA